MNRLLPGQGLLGCCSPCHTVFGEELCSRSGESGARPIPWLDNGSSLVPAAVASIRGSINGADWTPKAAAGAASRASPPQELLVDCAHLSGVPAAVGSSSKPGGGAAPEVKELERARLRRLVDGFRREAAEGGRLCQAIPLSTDPGERPGLRRAARYELGQSATQLVVHGEASEDSEWEVLNSSTLQAMLGVHRVEQSALMQKQRPELVDQISEEELERSAVLEFAAGVPLLIIEESVEHRERLVVGVQILQLYQGAARRLQSARDSKSRGSPRVDPSESSASAAEVPTTPRRPHPPEHGTHIASPLGRNGGDCVADAGGTSPMSESTTARSAVMAFGGRFGDAFRSRARPRASPRLGCV
eukprot:CAMPEP_0117525274 /NCGR_PEP_ID=MMETSP0784-20121206/35684_1 /TAXON_ID=39447 /ORGANISM="" /LENGTH=359 /DNA_ID=CAMNT_0005321463 /DNA_START=82 /DNA_END=1158 /DNA_ORIENTATION=-